MNNQKNILKKWVFFPTWLMLVGLAVVSLANADRFLDVMNQLTAVILDNFAWLFTLTPLLCLATIIIVYFSPLAKVRIGGSKAVPMMNFQNVAWITLCTTVAAGILFWGVAEPLYHFYAPAITEGVEPESPGAALFAMKTMFLEWTWTPYSTYAVATILFSFLFYNMHQAYSIGSYFVPIFGKKGKRFNGIIDVVCLFSLVLGMSSALGTGTMSLAGGIESLTGIKSASAMWGVIIIALAVTFIFSSISGVMNGIRMLSSVNGYVYVFLMIFVFIFGPTVFMLNFSTEAFGVYLKDFFQISLMTGDIYGDGWTKSWPIFYWCVWMAWAPISGAFLGKILKGYTIKDGIKANFIIPSIFSMIWMGIFSSTTLYYEMHGAKLYESLLTNGTESVVYLVLEQLPLAGLLIPLYVAIIFITFVTAADSNTNAMSGLCVEGLTIENTESPAYLKACWGATLGVLTWIIISFAGIDGIKAASNLGGFPMMFLMIIICIGLLKICKNPKKYDVFKEDYDEEGNPIISKRLPVQKDI